MFNLGSLFATAQQPTQAAAPQPNTGATPANTGTPTNPGNIPNAAATATSAATTGTAPNGVVPAGTDTKDATQSSLDAFKDLWQTPANSTEGAPQSIFNVDPAKLREAAYKENFASVVSPELMQKINAGGPEAMQAMLEAMNNMAREAYMKSAMASTRFAEHAANKSAESVRNDLPGQFKKFQVSDSLRTENPAFNHPAVQPIVTALEQQLAVKFPNATAKELREQATTYLQASFAAMNPNSQSQSNTNNQSKGNGNDYDWSSFFNVS